MNTGFSYQWFFRVFRAMRGAALRKLVALLCLGLGLALASPALAQQSDPELDLSLKRDFGYGGGNRIQGLFTLRAAGPEDLARVEFFIDDQKIGEDTEAPFAFQFSTDSYPLGLRSLQAIGTTQGGRQIDSDIIQVEFVTADEGWRTVGRILVPLLVVVFGLMFLSFAVPWLFRRGKPVSLPAGAPRSYGLTGGAICPKCGRPFGMHLFGLNLMVGKLDRCPYCGRWSLVRRASPAELRQAELAELDQSAEPELQLSPEEQLRRDLDSSRYEDA
jgi:hypothetical protein